MVEETDVDRARQSLDLLCHRDIGGAGLGGSRWMIVGEDDAMRADVKGAGEEAPQRSFDLCDRPLRDGFVGQIAPVMGDEGDVQALGRRLADRQPKIRLKTRIGGGHRGARHLFAKPRFDQRPRSDDGFGKLAVAFQGVGELIAAGGQRPPDTPEMPDQPFGCGVGKRSGKGFEEMRQDR